MNTFVEDLADLIVKSGIPLKDVTVVLPGKRTAVFLKRALKARIQETSWLPVLTTLPEIIGQMASSGRGDRLDLTFLLYQTHLELSNSAESLDSFLSWGPTVLSDFNEIDHQLLDAAAVLKNLRDYKELDNWSFNEEPLSAAQMRFMEFWDSLLPLYRAFQQTMLNNNAWYGGALAKKVASQPITLFDVLQTQHIFVAGLNALTKAEQHILTKLQEAGKLTFVWDADRYFVHDRMLEAGHFVRKHPHLGHIDNLPCHFANNTHQITIAGCSSSIMQAQHLGAILDDIPEEDAMDTAIILPDNAQLSAVLPAIPEKFKALNITMGLSVKDSPLRSLLHHFFRLFDTRENPKYQHFLAIIRHPLFRNKDSDILPILTAIDAFVVQKRLVYIPIARVVQEATIPAESPLHTWLLLLAETCKNRSVDLIFKALESLLRFIEPKNEEPGDTILFQTWLTLLSGVQKLNRLAQSYPVFSEPREVEKVLSKLIGQMTVDLIGEPLQGLQIMGLLESRSLDFKRVIVLSCNEGHVPKSAFSESMLPADLRAAFELPGRYEREAIFAYYFYRLLSRATDIHLLYSEGESDFKSGEKSRYLQQILTCPLIAEMPIDLEEQHIVSHVPEPAPEIPPLDALPWIIERTKELLRQGLYPSAIQKWSACTADFFFRFLLALYEQDNLEESMEDNTLGTIVHSVLENGFKRYINTPLKAEHIDEIFSRLDQLIDSALGEHYNAELMETGINYLKRSIIRKFVEKILLRERKDLVQQHTVTISELEKKFSATFELNEAFSFVIGGKVDRSDIFDGTRRIIDYKSGGVTQDDLTLKLPWEDAIMKKDMGKALQMFLYTFLAYHEFDCPVQGGIISSRSHRAGFIPLKFENSASLITFNSSLAQSAEAWVKGVVSAMINPSDPPVHNEKAKFCEYCIIH